MSQESVLLPADRMYDQTSYLWVKEDSESGNLLVGIGSPTIESLGELSYLKLSSPGTVVQRGDSVGSMEAAKMTGEIVSPVSGTIFSINELLLDDPRKASEDPYGAGWLLNITPASWSDEQTQLLDSSALYDSLPDELRGIQRDE